MNTITALLNEKVSDILFLQVQSATCSELFEYCIEDPLKNIVRKGIFRAPDVQIRTSLMKGGKYLLHLYKSGEECFSASFRKE